METGILTAAGLSNGANNGNGNSNNGNAALLNHGGHSMQMHHNGNGTSNLLLSAGNVNIGNGVASMRGTIYHAPQNLNNGIAHLVSHHVNGRAPPSYDHSISRLPESPPETDSGGGSAGSPSSSETSPYSPDYQGYLHATTVIHPPVLGNQQGVILSVPDLTAVVLNEYSFHSHHPTATIHHHGSTNQTSPNNNHSVPLQATGTRLLNGNTSNGHGDFYANAPTPGPPPNVVAHQQTSPNGYAPSQASNQQYTNLLPQQQYGSEGNLSRKRLRSEGGQYISPPIKPEPSNALLTASPRNHCSDESLFDGDGVSHQCIRFSEFQKDSWHSLCDFNGRELSALGFHVVADKGFNFSVFDGAFVNQKKNHFQVSVHIEVRDRSPPKYVKIPGEGGGLKQIMEFQLDFFGVKAEMLSSSVLIKQSQTDRKPISYEPVRLDLPPNRVTKVTVARLHFSETTMNNQRKNGRPNPDQKYFFLVVALNAVIQGNQGTEKHTVISYASERVIVRASNPGQFDNGDSETHWQKGQTPNSVYHPVRWPLEIRATLPAFIILGLVGIGTDRPHTTLTVAGDISYTGNLYHPSDARLKENIRELNTTEALSRMSQIRIVRYCIRPDIAEQFGLTPEECERVGVIAQEVEEVLPDAVKENGEYLQVDESRIFYESAAAVKELCRLTGNLEYKIDEVERISKKLSRLSKLKRFDSIRSTASSIASQLSSSPIPIRAADQKRCLDKYMAHDPTEKDCMTSPGEKYTSAYAASKHKHHRRSSADRGLCSSKSIQTTVICLVVVMAFCLIAMATLYVLDWHKRNYGSPLAGSNSNQDSLADGLHGTSKQGEEPGQLIQQQSSYYTHKPSTLALPTVLHEFPKPPWESGDSSVAHMPTPLQACASTDCSVFCCAEDYAYTIDSLSVNDPVQIVLAQTQSPKPAATVKKTLNSKKHKISPTDSSAKAGSGEEDHSAVKQNHSTEAKPKEPFVVVGNVKTNRIEVVSSNQSSNPDKAAQSDNQRQRRAVDEDELDDYNVTIRMPSLNTSIDERYCYGIGCDKPKFGRQFYFVPVSRHTPLFALDVQFGIPSGWSVELCSYQTEELCFGMTKSEAVVPSADSPELPAKATASQSNNERDSWKLPIGQHVKSAYKFRAAQSTTACDEPVNAAGSTYFEYNLLFYRVCTA